MYFYYHIQVPCNSFNPVVLVVFLILLRQKPRSREPLSAKDILRLRPQFTDVHAIPEVAGQGLPAPKNAAISIKGKFMFLKFTSPY